jgi:hypothetical protein
MAITTTTPNLKIRQLKITISHADLATGATTNTVAIYSLPANSTILSAWTKVTANFTGGSISAYTLSVGSSAANLLNTFSAFTGTPLSTSCAFNDGLGAYNTFVKSTSAATTINIYATSTGANLDAATAGSVDVFLLVGEVG